MTTHFDRFSVSELSVKVRVARYTRRGANHFAAQVQKSTPRGAGSWHNFTRERSTFGLASADAKAAEQYYRVEVNTVKVEAVPYVAIIKDESA